MRIGIVTQNKRTKQTEAETARKTKNQIAEAIWLVVEMRGIEPLTS